MIRLIIVIISIVLLVGCRADNAYDFNSIDSSYESQEAYLSEEVIVYESSARIFSREEVDSISHNGQKVQIDDKYLKGKWTHGILNFPLVILNDDNSVVIDLLTQEIVIDGKTIRDQLNNSWQQLLGIKNISLNPIDFTNITVAQYCPNDQRVAFIIESSYEMGATYSVVGYYDPKSQSSKFTNIAKGGFIPMGYGGDSGPFWGPDGCDYAYTLGDLADSGRYLYVDCHLEGNVVRLNGEVLQYYLDLKEDESFYFPGFKELKWRMEGKRLMFSTRSYDNSEESLNWVMDITTGVVELME